jgi:hypothetical protein
LNQVAWQVFRLQRGLNPIFEASALAGSKADQDHCCRDPDHCGFWLNHGGFYVVCRVQEVKKIGRRPWSGALADAITRSHTFPKRQLWAEAKKSYFSRNPLNSSITIFEAPMEMSTTLCQSKGRSTLSTPKRTPPFAATCRAEAPVGTNEHGRRLVDESIICCYRSSLFNLGCFCLHPRHLEIVALTSVSPLQNSQQ